MQRLYARRASALLYRLLRARPRGRWLVPANVCRDVAATFRAAGVAMQLVDIDPGSLALDLRHCATLLRARRRSFTGLLFVRPYGALEDVDEQLAQLLAIDGELLLVDDRCLCAPDAAGGSVSPVIDVTLFSTGARKAVSLDGGGFALLRRPLALADEEAAASAPDWLQLGAPGEPWESYRDRIEREAPAIEAHRRELNAIYHAGLPASIQLPDRFHGWRFQVRLPDAERLLDAIFAVGLFASRHYQLVEDADPAAYPVAAALRAEVVNLFNDRHVDAAMASRLVELVRAHLAGAAVAATRRERVG